MKVKELIERLQKFDPEMPVLTVGPLKWDDEHIAAPIHHDWQYPVPRLKTVVRYECHGGHMGSYDVTASEDATPPNFQFQRGEPYPAVVIEPFWIEPTLHEEMRAHWAAQRLAEKADD
jgi:hypothetical protein